MPLALCGRVSWKGRGPSLGDCPVFGDSPELQGGRSMVEGTLGGGSRRGDLHKSPILPGSAAASLSRGPAPGGAVRHPLQAKAPCTWASGALHCGAFPERGCRAHLAQCGCLLPPQGPTSLGKVSAWAPPPPFTCLCSSHRCLVRLRRRHRASVRSRGALWGAQPPTCHTGGVPGLGGERRLPAPPGPSLASPGAWLSHPVLSPLCLGLERAQGLLLGLPPLLSLSLHKPELGGLKSRV